MYLPSDAPINFEDTKSNDVHQALGQPTKIGYRYGSQNWSTGRFGPNNRPFGLGSINRILIGTLLVARVEENTRETWSVAAGKFWSNKRIPDSVSKVIHKVSDVAKNCGTHATVLAVSAALSNRKRDAAIRHLYAHGFVPCGSEKSPTVVLFVERGASTYTITKIYCSVQYCFLH